MVRRYLLICFLAIFQDVYATAQQIEGLLPLTTSGNASALLYHEGAILIGTQSGVEVFLYNQIIGNFRYNSLIGRPQISRDDTLRLIKDGSNVIVWDQSHSKAGVLDYKSGKAWIDAGKVDEASNNLPATSTEENNVRSVLQDRGIIVTALIKNEFLSRNNAPVWLVGTRTKGLLQYYFDEKCETILRSESLRFKSSSSTQVRHILSLLYLSEFNSVVIGTCGDGAYLWSQMRDQVFTPVFDPKEDSDGQERHFWSFAKLNSSSFLAGNDMGQVLEYNNKGINNTKHLVSLSGGSVSEEEQRVLCLQQWPGKPGRYLAGTHEGDIFGLYPLPLPKGGFRSELLFKLGTGSQVKCFFADVDKKQVWVGTDKGIWLLDAVGNFVKKDSTLNADFFVSNGVNIYFGNREGQLGVIGSNGNIEALAAEDFKGNEFCNMLFLENGKVLLFTRNNFMHLGRLDGRTLTFEYKFYNNNGLVYRDRENGNHVYPMSTIYGGYEAEGIVWCSTNFGLLRFNPYDSNTIVNYYYKNATGIPAVEYNTNAFLQLNDSLLIFGSRRGLVIVNTRQASRYQNRNRPDFQLWRVENQKPQIRPKGNHLQYQYSEQNFLFLPDSSKIALDYEDKNTLFFPVSPDYSLLETPLLYLANGSIDTAIFAAGRSFSPEFFMGKPSHFRKNVSLKFGDYAKLNSNNKTNLKATLFHFVQSFSSSFWMFVISLMIILSFILLSRIKNKQVQAENARLARQVQEQKRLQTFIELGKALATARSYEGLHEELQSALKDAYSVLGDSQISIYVFEKGRMQLRTIAHARTDADLMEYNHVSSKGIYFLNDPEDQRRPIIHQWKKGNMHEPLIINDASSEFYKGEVRPIVKLDQIYESFIFKTLEIDEKPAAILSIQNEKTNAYTGEKLKETLQHLDIIGYFVGLSLDIIERTRSAQVEQATLLHFNQIAEKRLSQHIANNFVERIGRIYPDSRPTTDAFKNFLSEVYTADPLAYGNYELNIIRHYIPLCKFLYEKEEINVTVTNESLIQRYRIPAFILLNTVNNSMKHCHKAKINIEIKGEKEEENGFLMLSVEDDGAGIDFQKLKERNEQRSSTFLIAQYFASLEQKTGYKIPAPEMKNIGPGGTCAKVTFRLPFVLLELFKKI